MSMHYRLPQRYHAKVVALHVIELRKYLYADYAASMGTLRFLESLLPGRQRETTGTLEGALARGSHGAEEERESLNVRTVKKFGNAYKQIVAHAGETHTCLMAMTACGGDALDRAVFGSTTYRVIQLGPCPVLAVHT